jgi:hypothetical protein
MSVSIVDRVCQEVRTRGEKNLLPGWVASCHSTKRVYLETKWSAFSDAASDQR